MSKIKRHVENQNANKRGTKQQHARAAGAVLLKGSAIEKVRGAKVSDIPPTVNTGERLEPDAHLHEAPYVFQKQKTEATTCSNQEAMDSYLPPATAPIQLCMRDGKVVMQMIRIPALTECCTVDTLRLTMNEKSVFNFTSKSLITDEDIARGFSQKIEEILGFGITKKYEKGRDFFSDAWEIGDNYGHFAMGGIKQRDSILIAINGQGCLAAKEGWELRLYKFLTSGDCIAPRITRVDLAHDDFDGSQLSVYDFDRAWDDGGFDRFGNRPEPQNYGSWKNNDPMGKGLTFYAGTKSSSQLFRGYQKGKQLGSPESPWVRAEVQFSNHDKIIPLEILIDPSSYFVAAYPVLQQYSPSKTGKRTETIKKLAEAGMEHFTKYTKLGYGKFIRIGRQFYGDKEFLDLVQADEDIWPARLKMPNHKCETLPIHRQPEVSSSSPFTLTASDLGYTDDDSSLHSQFSHH